MLLDDNGTVWRWGLVGSSYVIGGPSKGIVEPSSPFSFLLPGLEVSSCSAIHKPTIAIQRPKAMYLCNLGLEHTQLIQTLSSYKFITSGISLEWWKRTHTHRYGAASAWYSPLCVTFWEEARVLMPPTSSYTLHLTHLRRSGSHFSVTLTTPPS